MRIRLSQISSSNYTSKHNFTRDMKNLYGRAITDTQTNEKRTPYAVIFFNFDDGSAWKKSKVFSKAYGEIKNIGIDDLKLSYYISSMSRLGHQVREEYIAFFSENDWNYFKMMFESNTDTDITVDFIISKDIEKIVA